MTAAGERPQWRHCAASATSSAYSAGCVHSVSFRSPLDAVPAWEQTRFANWPAIVALLVAVIYGAIASAILPGSLGYDSPRNWGPVPLECWLLAGVLYTVLVAVTRTVDARELLAFPRHLDDRAVESPAVIDVASGAAPAPTPAAPSAQPSWT